MKKGLQRAFQSAMCSLVLVGAACQQDIVESPADDTAGSAEPSQQMSESDHEAQSVGDQLTRQVAGAVTDLANRTGVAQDTITVRDARLVNWGSGAVGCPEKGKNYTDAIVPGVLLYLEINGEFFRYHGRSEGSLFLCPEERAIPPAYGQGQEFM